MNSNNYWDNGYRGRGKRGRGPRRWQENVRQPWDWKQNSFNPRFIPPNQTRWPSFGYTSPRFFSQRIPFEPPICNERPFRSPPPLRIPTAALSRSESPLPGSEEYTLRNIQQTSERIKRQLNLSTESDGSPSDYNINDRFNTTFSTDDGTVSETDVLNNDSHKISQPLYNQSDSFANNKIKQVKKQSYSVQEICNKIITHISNLNDGKKKNLIHIGSSGYEEAIKQIQRNERLELSRALRDMCNQQTQDTSEVINSIIPDIGIRIEDLPPEIIHQLSTTLNLDPEEHFETSQNTFDNVDPELFFKQAESMLTVDFEESFFNNPLDDTGADMKVPNFTVEKKSLLCSTSPLDGFCNPEPPTQESAPILKEPLIPSAPIICAPPSPVLTSDLTSTISFVEQLESLCSKKDVPLPSVTDMPVTSSLSVEPKTEAELVPTEFSFASEYSLHTSNAANKTSLENTYKEFESQISTGSDTLPVESTSSPKPSSNTVSSPSCVKETDTKRSEFTTEINVAAHQTKYAEAEYSTLDFDLLPKGFKLSSSYLNYPTPAAPQVSVDTTIKSNHTLSRTPSNIPIKIEKSPVTEAPSIPKGGQQNTVSMGHTTNFIDKSTTYTNCSPMDVHKKEKVDKSPKSSGSYRDSRINSKSLPREMLVKEKQQNINVTVIKTETPENFHKPKKVAEQHIQPKGITSPPSYTPVQNTKIPEKHIQPKNVTSSPSYIAVQSVKTPEKRIQPKNATSPSYSAVQNMIPEQHIQLKNVTSSPSYLLGKGKHMKVTEKHVEPKDMTSSPSYSVVQHMQKSEKHIQPKDVTRTPSVHKNSMLSENEPTSKQLQLNLSLDERIKMELGINVGNPKSKHDGKRNKADHKSRRSQSPTNRTKKYKSDDIRKRLETQVLYDSIIKCERLSDRNSFKAQSKRNCDSGTIQLKDNVVVSENKKPVNTEEAFKKVHLDGENKQGQKQQTLNGLDIKPVQSNVVPNILTVEKNDNKKKIWKSPGEKKLFQPPNTSMKGDEQLHTSITCNESEKVKQNLTPVNSTPEIKSENDSIRKRDLMENEVTVELEQNKQLTVEEQRKSLDLKKSNQEEQELSKRQVSPKIEVREQECKPEQSHQKQKIKLNEQNSSENVVDNKQEKTKIESEVILSINSESLQSEEKQSTSLPLEITNLALVRSNVRCKSEEKTSAIAKEQLLSPKMNRKRLLSVDKTTLNSFSSIGDSNKQKEDIKKNTSPQMDLNGIPDSTQSLAHSSLTNKSAAENSPKRNVSESQNAADDEETMNIIDEVSVKESIKSEHDQQTDCSEESHTKMQDTDAKEIEAKSVSESDSQPKAEEKHVVESEFPKVDEQSGANNSLTSLKESSEPQYANPNQQTREESAACSKEKSSESAQESDQLKDASVSNSNEEKEKLTAKKISDVPVALQESTTGRGRTKKIKPELRVENTEDKYEDLEQERKCGTNTLTSLRESSEPHQHKNSNQQRQEESVDCNKEDSSESEKSKVSYLNEETEKLTAKKISDVTVALQESTRGRGRTKKIKPELRVEDTEGKYGDLEQKSKCDTNTLTSLRESSEPHQHKNSNQQRREECVVCNKEDSSESEKSKVSSLIEETEEVTAKKISDDAVALEESTKVRGRPKKIKPELRMEETEDKQGVLEHKRKRGRSKTNDEIPKHQVEINELPKAKRGRGRPNTKSLVNIDLNLVRAQLLECSAIEDDAALNRQKRSNKTANRRSEEREKRNVTEPKGMNTKETVPLINTDSRASSSDRTLKVKRNVSKKDEKSASKVMKPVEAKQTEKAFQHKQKEDSSEFSKPTSHEMKVSKDKKNAPAAKLESDGTAEKLRNTSIQKFENDKKSARTDLIARTTKRKENDKQATSETKVKSVFRDKPCPASKKKSFVRNEVSTTTDNKSVSKIEKKHTAEHCNAKIQSTPKLQKTLGLQTDHLAFNKDVQTETILTNRHSQTVEYPCLSCLKYRKRVERRKYVLKKMQKLDLKLKNLIAAREKLYEGLSSDSEAEVSPAMVPFDDNEDKNEKDIAFTNECKQDVTNVDTYQNLESMVPEMKQKCYIQLVPHYSSVVENNTDNSGIDLPSSVSDKTVSVTLDPSVETDTLNGAIVKKKRKRKLASINNVLTEEIQMPKKMRTEDKPAKPFSKPKSQSRLLKKICKKFCKQHKDVNATYMQNCKVHLKRYSDLHFEKMKEKLKSQNSTNASNKLESPLSKIKIVSVESLASNEAEYIEAKAMDAEYTNKALVTETRSGSSSQDYEEIVPNDVEPDVENLFEISFLGFSGVVLIVKAIGSNVLAATDSGKIWCYGLPYGEHIYTFDVTNLALTSMCISKNENNEDIIFSGSLDAKLRIHNYQTKELLKSVNIDERIQCIEHAWGCIFIGSDNGYLVRYNVASDKIEYFEKISDYNVLVLKATREGTRKVLLVATRNSAVSVRDAMSGLYMRSMETPFLPTVYTLILEDNLVYCGTSQHDILVYTFQDGQLIFRHEASKSKGVVCMQILGNLLFAGCYNGNIYVYNTKRNAYLGSMVGPGGLLLCMTIVRNLIIVGTKANKFKAWKIPCHFLENR